MNPSKSSIRLLLGLLTVLALLSSACQLAPTPAPASAPTEASNLPATGTGPQVLVQDQVYDGKTVKISEIVSAGPGWIAIHNQNANGAIGPAIGHAPVQDGDNKDVVVEIDPKQATPVMYAMLHTDAGKVGVYEFPDGPDVPVVEKGQILSPSFKVTLSATSGQVPKVVAIDQDVKGEVVQVADVVSDGPGWVVIQAQNADGSPGQEIGYAAVPAGESQNVMITIDASKATPVLLAVLHRDAGEAGIYDPQTDLPVKSGEQVVAASFKSSGAAVMEMPTPPTEAQPQGTEQAMNMGTQTPMDMGTQQPTETPSAKTTSPAMVMATPGAQQEPLVEVSDQPVEGGVVNISRVVSSGPGWIVIYTDNSGQPGDPIGETAVKDGESRDVKVKIDASKATPTLYALLHVDQGTVGQFEFPGPDAPIMLGVKMIQAAFSASAGSTTPAAPVGSQNPVITAADQEIRGGTVKIADVVSSGPGWIGIHNQGPDGQPGPPIGDAHIQGGESRDVVVKIDASKATGVMYAMLHTDAGQIGVWEFPGPDVPVMVKGQMVSPAFKVTGGLPKQALLIDIGQSAGIAPFLVDGAGMTLYISLSDSAGKSNCDALCRLTWLPVTVPPGGRLSAGQGVAGGKLGIISLPDGNKQVTYGGQPLYYYVKDNTAGDVGGQGIDGNWFASTP